MLFRSFCNATFGRKVHHFEKISQDQLVVFLSVRQPLFLLTKLRMIISIDSETTTSNEAQPDSTSLQLRKQGSLEGKSFDCVPGSLFPFIPLNMNVFVFGLLRFPGGKKVIASSLNEDVLGPQEEHLSLSIQRSETASLVGDIGSPSLLSSPWLGSGLV